MNMIDTLNFEIAKLVHKRNILLFLIFCFLLTIFINIGVSDYRLSLRHIEIFQNSEKTKVNQYSLYNQYGGFGIRLLFVPSSISIFLSDNNDSLLLANVNAAEALKIFEPYKGKYVFKSSGYMFYAGLLYLVGGLFCLLYGFTIKKDFLKVLSHFSGYSRAFISYAISRIIIIWLVFCLLSMYSIFLILINSVRIDIRFFFYWFIFGGLVFTFFYISGLVISKLKEKDKVISLVILGAFYFLFILLIPWTIEKIVQVDASRIESYFDFELTNINLYNKIEKRLIKQFGPYRKLTDDEKDVFMKEVHRALNSEFKEIFERESQMKMEISRRIKLKQILSSFFPTTLLLSINKEIGTTGFLNFIDFYDFAFKRKKGFLEFYIFKSFLNQNKPGKIENFIKGNENLFFAKSRLPHGFCLGVGLTLLYTIGFFFIAYRLHLKKPKKESKKIDVDIDFKEGKNTVFVLCKNHRVKEEIYTHYQEQKNTICLEKINPADFMFNGIKPGDLLKHLSRAAGVDEKKARENLGIMGIDIDTVKAGKTRGNLRVFTADAADAVDSDAGEKEKANELILKIYAAVKMAADRPLIVLNEFLKKESRQFEADCIKLLSTLLAAGKKIIYLSTEMYQTASRFEDKIKIDKFGLFHISDIKEISLR